eukprot:gene12640-biopygen9069
MGEVCRLHEGVQPIGLGEEAPAQPLSRHQPVPVTAHIRGATLGGVLNGAQGAPDALVERRLHGTGFWRRRNWCRDGEGHMAGGPLP